MTPDEEIYKLKGIIKRQRKELRNLNKAIITLWKVIKLQISKIHERREAPHDHSS